MSEVNVEFLQASKKNKMIFLNIKTRQLTV